MALPEIKIVFDAVTDRFNRNVASAERSLGGVRGAADATARRLGALGDRLNQWGRRMSIVSGGIVAAGGAMFALAASAANAGDEIAKSAAAVGLSTDSFQELRFAIGQVSDLTDQQFTGAMRQLNTRLGQAAAGSQTMIAALEKIGISQQDVADGTVGSEQAFMAFAAAVKDTASPAEAAALAAALFGEEASKLGPLLRDQGTDIESLRRRAQELGIVLGDDVIQSSSRFKDQMRELSFQTGALKMQIGAALLPVLTESLIPALQEKVIPAIGSMIDKVASAIQWFTDLPAPVQEAAGLIAGALGVAGPVLLAVGAMSKAFGLLVAATGPVGLFLAAAGLLIAAWQTWGDSIGNIVGDAVAWLGEQWEAAKAAALAFADAFVQAHLDAANLGIEYMQRFLDWITGLPQQLLDIGRNIVQGLLDGINEKWEELKAKIYEMAEALPQWMKDLLGIESPSRVFMEIGQFIGEGLAQGIADAEGMVRDAVGVLSDGAVSETEAAVAGILGALGQLFQKSKGLAIAQALVNTFQGATEALKLPYPKNLVAFAKTAATGLGAVKSIRSAQPGGGGGGGAAVGAGAGGGAVSGSAGGGGGGPASGPQEVLVKPQGPLSDLFRAFVGPIADALREEYGDRGVNLAVG